MVMIDNIIATKGRVDYYFMAVNSFFEKIVEYYLGVLYLIISRNFWVGNHVIKNNARQISGVIMSRRLRIMLILLALVFIAFAAIALVYALTPLESQRLQATLAPTLFIPPPP
jgi:hypothetical protein